MRVSAGISSVISMITVVCVVNSQAQWKLATGIASIRVLGFGSDGGTLYAGTNGSDVFASTDHGESWSSTANTGMYNHTINSIAYSNGNILAGSNDQMFLSVNQGANWSSARVGYFGSVVTDGALAIGGITNWDHFGVYISSSSGDSGTWHQSNNGLPGVYPDTITSLKLNYNDYSISDPAPSDSFPPGFTLVTTIAVDRNSGSVYAGLVYDGTYHSVYDPGLGKYEQVDTGVAGVYHSTDSGANWVGPSDNTLYGVPAISLVVSPSGSIFLGTFQGKIYKSTDGGLTWTLLSELSLESQETVNALIFVGTTLIAGLGGSGSGGVWASPDSGLTWYPQLNGLGNLNVDALFSDGTNLVAGTYGGSYYLPLVDVSLDVQATSFKASAVWNGIQLSWIAQSQVDNAGFNILRKDPGSTSYELIASYTSNDSLKGLGTTTSPTTYTFTDTKVQSGQTYTYMVQSVSTTGRTAEVNTISATAKIPQSYALYQNFPNPFNPSTTIIFDLKQASHVTLDIYNVLGQKVLQQNYGNMQAGSYQRTINMDRFASGVYFYMLKAAGQNSQPFQSVKKMILLK